MERIIDAIKCRRAASLLLAGVLFLSGCATQSGDVGQPSVFRNLVSADEVEKQVVVEYGKLKADAAQKGELVSSGDPQVRRLHTIAKRLIPFGAAWNPQANNWQWEVILLRSDQVNAFCMPGGKIAFYTAILDQLKLTDDEVAVVMGHEIAHALREHVRKQMGQGALTQWGATIASTVVGGGLYGQLFSVGSGLLSLTFSRSDEAEADHVGLELSSRAGYDPQAGVTLWKKMAAAQGGKAPPAFLSTHPSDSSRIANIEKLLPRMQPLYEEAKKNMEKTKND